MGLYRYFKPFTWASHWVAGAGAVLDDDDDDDDGQVRSEAWIICMSFCFPASLCALVSRQGGQLKGYLTRRYPAPSYGSNSQH